MYTIPGQHKLGQIRGQREAIHKTSRDIGLKEDVHFAVRILHTSFYGQAAVYIKVLFQLQ